jgi:hypothetical protein
MDYKQKAEDYRVSIRRKNLNEKMATIRAKHKEAYSEIDNPKAVVEHIKQILSSTDSGNLYKNVKDIKLSSQNAEVMVFLKNQF